MVRHTPQHRRPAHLLTKGSMLNTHTHTVCKFSLEPYVVVSCRTYFCNILRSQQHHKKRGMSRKINFACAPGLRCSDEGFCSCRWMWIHQITKSTCILRPPCVKTASGTVQLYFCLQYREFRKLGREQPRLACYTLVT